MDFNPFRYQDLQDPYPAYRELRDQAPVYWSESGGVFCVSRYDDVLQVLKSPDVFSSRAMFTMLMNQGQEGAPPLTPRVIGMLVRIFLRTRMNPFEFATARNLIAEDGDRHTHMRNIVNRGFTPRRIEAWEARTRQVVKECVEKLGHGSFDVMRDLAIPLPVTVIAEMIGIEAERRADFKRWSDTFVSNISGPGRQDPYNKPFQHALIELTKYMQRITRERRASPTDDLISTIVAEQEGAIALTDREVMQFVMLLLIAGNETTTNLIGNSVTALLDHPEQIARLAEDPERVPLVLDETLRYDAPIQLVFRKATRPAELHGTMIPEGANVVVLLGSANRDERRFDDPDRFDPDRDTRGHLGFGFGKHFCLGSSLARLEARVALEALAPVLGRFERTESKPTLVESFLVRGPRRLELRAVV
jgi:cytochrome P450